MYLHLGDEFIIPYRDIIGIFDLDTVTETKLGQEYLRRAQKTGEVMSISENLPKSFIVFDKGGKTKVFISPISASTLQRRIKRGIDTEITMDSEGISWTSKLTHSTKK